jgi:D-alanine-D-alanine ligase
MTVMAAARILIVYNAPVLPPGHPEAASEIDVLENVDEVARVLRESGYSVSRLGVGQNLAPLLEVLKSNPPDAIFNLFEGLADQPSTEEVVAGIYEWFGIPFTGSPAFTLALARDKRRANWLLRGAGLPVARFFAVEHLPVPPCPLSWPVIVKPAGTDASLGIEQRSVVESQAELEEQVGRVLQSYGPAVVEEYIPGREFLMHVVEGAPDQTGRSVPLVLPPGEVVFLNPHEWPIYTYRAKWDRTAPEFMAADIRSAVVLPPEWHERIVTLCRSAFQVLGCRDYARIDIRMTPAGEPYVLEVNPNPFLTHEIFYEVLDAIGRCHSQLLIDLIAAALARGRSSIPREIA